MNTYNYYALYEVSTYSNITTPREMDSIISVDHFLDVNSPASKIAMERILTKRFHNTCGEDFVRVRIKSLHSEH